MLAKGRHAFSGILSIGSRTGGMSPIVTSKLYWSCVASAMLYGAEVSDLCDKSVEILEKEHRKFGKKAAILT